MRWRPNLVGWPIILALLFQGRAHLRSAGRANKQKRSAAAFRHHARAFLHTHSTVAVRLAEMAIKREREREHPLDVLLDLTIYGKAVRGGFPKWALPFRRSVQGALELTTAAGAGA
jgi:hypothetical protein